ncbi:hypothetical protein [Methylobacterium sp. V23]|uniref:hypothetical protein n=1 Tax=Methylobacterium sp. V23 TaxID=2044878 RepID=UPI000CDAE03C|nr:hypothetical protein [Methylobacterium sp. V23]POR39852.1 hypothetical protein CRT23_27275 [Methylobacterium sp. V23]
MSASPKPKLVPAEPEIWRKAFLDLRPSVVPCPGFTVQSWGGAHEACVEFLDRWADEAAGLNWTTLELFGVHPEVGTIRPDFCGAMMLSAERVSAITDKHMRFGNMAFYRDKPGLPSSAVPLWLFGR